MSNVDRTVVTSMMVTLGSTLAAESLPTKYGGKGELPRPRLLIGTALTYFGLSIMADFAPSLAGPLAASIAITAMTYYGMPLADNWFNGKHDVVGDPSVKPTTTPKATK